MATRKKILSTILACGLVVSSVTGIVNLHTPLGGVTTVHAEGLPSQADELVNTMNAVHDQLTDDEKAAIRAARTKVQALDPTSPDDQKLITDSDVWSDISTAKTNFTGDASDVSYVTPEHVLDLLQDLAITYDPTFSGLEEARLDANDRKLLTQLEVLGATLPRPIGISDINDFVKAVKAAVKAEFDGKDAADMLNMVADAGTGEISADKVNGIIKTALSNVLGGVNVDGANLVAKVITGLGISADDLMALKSSLVVKLDPDQTAEKALAAAYVRTQASFDKTVEDNGRRLIPELSIWGIVVPNALLTWTVSGNENITYNATNGYFELSSSIGVGDSQTANVSAEDILFGKVLKKDIPITMTATSSSSNNSGNNNPGSNPSGNSTTGNTPDTTQVVNQATDQLDQLGTTGNSETTSNADKVTEAKQIAESAIRQLGTTEVESTTSSDGTVVANLDTAKLTSIFENVKKASDQITEKYNQVTGDQGGTPPKVTATVDLGTVKGSNAQFPITSDILQAAKDNGIQALAVKVNGVSLTFDLSALGNKDTKINIKFDDSSLATEATNLPVASKVVTFNLQQNGQAVDHFDQPVEVRIPVDSTNDVDTDLLTLAKIDNGKLIYYGGRYESGYLQAQRKSFSSYVVVEHKVTFNDTASVQSWAGRQIEVDAAKGIIQGRPSGQFDPNAQVTRAEFAKMIVLAFGLEDATATQNFSDVNVSAWYSPYIASAVQAGIVNGRTASTFDPDAPITRAEMATMAARALQVARGYADPSGTQSLAKFDDASQIQASLQAGVAFASDFGIVIGTPDHNFKPNDDSTRAQAAVVIYRLLGK